MALQSASLRAQGMELLIAYRKNPSISARNRLVQLNMGLVRQIAHRLSEQCSEPCEDLEQVGYLGLIHAVERFSPQKGYAFSSFAAPYIRGEMLHFLRDRGSTLRIPRRWQDLNQAESKARKALTHDLGRQPSQREIADRLHVSVAELEEMRLAIQNRLPLSLDAVVYPQTETPTTLGDTLPDTKAKNGFAFEEQQQLREALNQLEDKNRSAIEWVLLNGLSRREVAQKIGVSPMTITRRIQRGVQQMIQLLQPAVFPTDIQA